jgi:FKBP12-rapamycin complex-associated protein
MLIQVIPQLIARIDTPRALVGRLIHHLLIDIGKHHPQALVYPLTVASKSASMARRNAANKILKSMCEHSPVLVQQAVMVTQFCNNFMSFSYLYQAFVSVVQCF